MLSTKIPNDSPHLCLEHPPSLISSPPLLELLHKVSEVDSIGVWPCLVARNPSDRGGLVLGRKMAAHVRASTAKHEHDHVPQAAGRVVRDNLPEYHRVRIPASGDIRASLFHGEEQIAAFGTTKPIRRLSFGARPTPSARWAVVNSTG